MSCHGACFLDIDECTVGVCSDNAVCTNSDGSFVCRCLLGFSGDGLVCSGEYIV